MIEFVIADEVFNLVKKGRAQAEQVHAIGRWLASYGGELAEIIFNRKDDLDEADMLGGLSMLGEIASVLTADALIDLYIIVIGCSEEFAEENFDVVDLIEAVQTIYQEHETVRMVIDRFFSESSSVEEQDDSSTTSEEVMDGQTNKS